MEREIRARPMWKKGWEATLTIRFDANQLTLKEVTSLLTQMGKKVGLGFGRPDPNYYGCAMGWGTFRIERVA